MIVGFTGTRLGLTPEQAESLDTLISTLKPTQAHHGDCIGADAEFHECCVSRLSIWIVGHPPTSSAQRAFCKCDELRPAKDFLDRNKDIVKESDVLVACPDSDREKWRSGTWSTIRYARVSRKQIWIVYPNGKIAEESVK